MEPLLDHDHPVFLLILERLEQGLQNPLCVAHENFCVVCVLGLGVILAKDSPAVRERHSLWNACMRQLVAPRTAAQENSLRTQLQRNIDKCASIAKHAEHLADSKKQHITDSLVLFNSWLCIMLYSCIRAGPADSGVLSRAWNPHKRFRSSAGLWPTEPAQLFPYGSRQTVAALVKACEAFEDDGPWWILSTVIQLACPQISNHLFEHTAIQARLSSAIFVFIFYGTPFRYRLVSVDDPTRVIERQAAQDTPWLRSGRALRCVTAVLQSLHHGPYARADHMDRFLSTEMDHWYLAYGVAAKRYAETRVPEWDEMVTCLTPAAPYLQQARAAVSDEQVLALVAQRPRSWAVLHAVRLAVAALHSEQHCCGPACAQSALDHIGDRPPLPTCSKCRIARYCGTPCQRADWKGEHKRLCGAFSQLMPLFDGPGYAFRARKTGISDDQFARLGRWAAARGQLYRDVIRAEFTFPAKFEEMRRVDDADPSTP